MANDSPDPLESLLIDAEELDRARIASAISELVGIDRSSGAVRPHGPKYRQLGNREKVLAILLGVRAAQLIGKRENEAVRASEVPGLTGMPEGSVHSTLKSLRENYEVSQTEDGAYYLSDVNVIAAVEALEIARKGKDPSVAAVDTPRKRAKSGKAAKKKGAAERKINAASPSPSALVNELIDSGFFSEPRTLADVQKRIRTKRAYQIPVTTLSPHFARLARSGVLEREKNDGGKYAYFAASK